MPGLLFSCNSGRLSQKIENASKFSRDSVDKIYYSDYFSFAGKKNGEITGFAIDINRWKKKGKFKAGHFIAFYHETEGWVELKGKGNFPNYNKVLKKYRNKPWGFG